MPKSQILGTAEFQTVCIAVDDTYALRTTRNTLEKDGWSQVSQSFRWKEEGETVRMYAVIDYRRIARNDRSYLM